MGGVIPGSVLLPAGKQVEKSSFMYKNEGNYLFPDGYNSVIRIGGPDGYKYLTYQGTARKVKFINGYYAYEKYIEENVSKWEPFRLPRCVIDGCQYAGFGGKYMGECPLHSAESVAECEICGAPDPASSDRRNLLKHNLCFTCHFWTKTIDYDKVVLIDGNCYTVGPENTGGKKSWRGFAGRRFNILIDGETITTTNLWHQGKVPDRFLDRFKQHGEFVTNG